MKSIKMALFFAVLPVLTLAKNKITIDNQTDVTFIMNVTDRGGQEPSNRYNIAGHSSNVSFTITGFAAAAVLSSTGNPLIKVALMPERNLVKMNGCSCSDFGGHFKVEAGTSSKPSGSCGGYNFDRKGDFTVKIASCPSSKQLDEAGPS